MEKTLSNPLKYSFQSYKVTDKFEYSSHMHECYEVIYFIHGNAIYSNEEKSYQLRKGDLIITRPFSYHCITFQGDGFYTRANILFDTSFLSSPELIETVSRFEVVNCNHIPVIAEIIKSFEYYQNNFPTEDYQQIANLLIEQIFLTIKNAPASTETESLDETHILSPVIHYINENLSSIESLPQLCNELHISESYLHKLFKNTLKITPAKYIHTKRLFRAKKLLEMGKKPSEICFECGYNDYSTFYRNYQKLFKTSPSNFDASPPPSIMKID